MTTPSVDVASIVRTVQVGAATAQAAIDAVEQFGADTGTLFLRYGVVQLLHYAQEAMTADGDEAHLLDAYRRWLDVALQYYAPEPEADRRAYAHAAAALTAELQIATDRASGQD